MSVDERRREREMQEQRNEEMVDPKKGSRIIEVEFQKQKDDNTRVCIWTRTTKAPTKRGITKHKRYRNKREGKSKMGFPKTWPLNYTEKAFRFPILILQTLTISLCPRHVTRFRLPRRGRQNGEQNLLICLSHVYVRLLSLCSPQPLSHSLILSE